MKKDKYIGLENLEKINLKNKQMEKENKKKNNKKKRMSIFEKFTTKENIIIFSFLLIFLIIGWSLIKKYNPYNDIDYRNINITYLMSDSTVVVDREKYWILNDILLNLLYSDGMVSSEGTNGESTESSLYYKYSIEEYYDALLDDYRTYLAKDKYIEVMNNLISNYKENYQTLHTIGEEAPIRKIYRVNKLGENYYLIRLNTSTESYVGICLYEKESQFSVFYLT